MDTSRRNRGNLGTDSLVLPLPSPLKVSRPSELYRFAKDIFPICLDKSCNSTKTKQDRWIHKTETWGRGLRGKSKRNWVQIPRTQVLGMAGRAKLPCCGGERRKGGCSAASLAKVGQVLCLNEVGMKRTHKVELWLLHSHIQGANKEIYLKFISLFLFVFQKKK